MNKFRKRNFPTDQVRRFLEPGPIVLVSSAWKEERNIMTMGWHMMMGFEPSLLACYIWEANHSFELIRRSKQCVINLPTLDLVDTVVGIGNCSGADTDKFAKFGLTAQRGGRVEAPLLAECHSNFECRLYDGSQVGKHGLFIWEVVKAHVAVVPKIPQTVHYRGEGKFMVSGPDISRRNRFKPENLRRSPLRSSARAVRSMRPGKGGGTKPPSLFRLRGRRRVGGLGRDCGCAGFGTRWRQHRAGQFAWL